MQRDAMAKYKPYDYNQKIMVPVSLDEQLFPGSLEYTIHTLVERQIDTTIFHTNYNNDETGCRPYDPRILLKIILFGYARGLNTSRRLERACRENIIFMALTCGQAPDHSTIAAFVSSMKNQITSIFQDILFYCDEHGLLGGTTFSIDGCKLPSNASKTNSGAFEQLYQKKQRLEKRLVELISDHQRNDETARKVKRIENRIKKLDEFVETEAPKIGSRGKEIKSNITDNTSHLMHTSHGTTQGYNAQALVDSKNQIIVYADAGDSGQDDEQLPPMIDGAKENLKAIGKNADCLKNADMLGDAAYFSPTNLQKLKEEQINGYIPDPGFRKRDPRLITEKAKFSLADFDFNYDQDVYICPAGKTLIRTSDTKRNGKISHRRYVSNEKQCADCSFRHRCLSPRSSKRRWLRITQDEELASFTSELISKMDSDDGRKIYDQRLGMVEPVFANIRFQKWLDRFWRRGKEKVNIEWILYCTVHNIEKCIPFCKKPATWPAF